MTVRKDCVSIVVLEEVVSRFGVAGNGNERWNPRYVRYAAAHGMNPEAMLASDREAHPGGSMAGFMLWTDDRWDEYHAGLGCCPSRWQHVMSEQDHSDFDRMLDVMHPEPR